MYTPIDVETWPRRSTYEFFKEYEDPFFNFTAPVEVSALYRYCKDKGFSYSLACLYYALLTANSIREFRIRIYDERLVEFDKVHATQTILNDDETFSFAYFENKTTLAEFDAAGKAALLKYKQLRTFDVESDRVDLIYFSVIPWVSFTSFKHAGRIDRTQSVPRIVFGRMFEEGSIRKIPVSVDANHMIMDGFHVGRFFAKFQAAVNAH